MIGNPSVTLSAQTNWWKSYCQKFPSNNSNISKFGKKHHCACSGSWILAEWPWWTTVIALCKKCWSQTGPDWILWSLQGRMLNSIKCHLSCVAFANRILPFGVLTTSDHAYYLYSLDTSMTNVDHSKWPSWHGECYIRYHIHVVLLRVVVRFLATACRYLVWVHDCKTLSSRWVVFRAIWQTWREPNSLAPTEMAAVQGQRLDLDDWIKT